MYIEAIILPLIIGKIRGGKFKHLLDIQIRFWWLLPIAGFTEFIASILWLYQVEPLWHFIDTHTLLLHAITYSLMMMTIIMNIKEKGVILLLIGTLLNCTVILCNDGRMPVEISKLSDELSVEQFNDLANHMDLTHTILDKDTNLPFLADIIVFSKPLPVVKFMSIGDLFLIAGIFWLIQATMCKKIPLPSS